MQSLPTVLIPFDSAFANRVNDQLSAMGNPPGAWIKRPLDQLRIIHFMSISVVEAGPQDALLVLEASADGDSGTALTRIAEALRQPVLDLLRAAGVDEPGSELATFLIKHDRTIGQGWFARTLGLGFAGTPGMTVRRIRQEAALAWRIGRMRDTLADDSGALGKLKTVREALWQTGNAKWAFVAEPMPYRDTKSQSKAGAVVRTFFPIIGTLFWPLLLVLALPAAWLTWQAGAAVNRGAGERFGWLLGDVTGVLSGSVVFAVAEGFALIAVAVALLLYLRRLERTDAPDDRSPDAKHVREVMGRENVCAQNLLATVSDMKAGWLRRFALRVAFLTIGQMAAKEFHPGFLADLGTIHFARWILLPGARRLLFLSNYDGSLESYLEDFIQEAHKGVTGIWSNTAGFPRTRLLFLDGARDGDRLRRFVPRLQIPARFWYSGYPSLTATRIRTNAAIRSGIASAATDDAAEEWLACFGASGRAFPSRRIARPSAVVFNMVGQWLGETPPAPRAPLEKSKIPTLAFGGRKHLRHSACLMIRLKDDPAACRKWLADLEPVTYGSDREQKQALVLAFAASAFDVGKLELPPEDLATFSPPFINGMAEPCRARALGDTGPNAPERWLWGSTSKSVDALVVAYDSTAEELDERLKALEENIVGNGHTLAHRLRLAPLPESGAMAAEPFGFADGVSQPLVRGAVDEHAAGCSETVQEAGEFVLGYRDNSGYRPPTPAVAAEQDLGNVLPSLAGDPAGRHDLGRNGTYLAVRQLEQDTGRFTAWLNQAVLHVRAGTTSLASVPVCTMKNALAAKLVGRWQNGSSLAQHAANPGATHRNDFLYGSVDPSGLGCPLGAHTRRANPRDSFDPGSDRQLTITNRHRILRVGRKYDASGPGEQPGLLFMCLNADLGRQFEFIQQTWLLGRSFHGLEDEEDPMLGQGRRGARNFTIHTQHGPVRLRVPQGVVTVRGGGYFFMPGRDALRFLARSGPQARGHMETNPGRRVPSDTRPVRCGLVQDGQGSVKNLGQVACSSQSDRAG